MKFNLNIVAMITAGGVAALLSMPVVADFDKRIYVGVGGGVSFIEPDPERNATAYENDETTDTGAKVFLGWDFSERWGFEGYFASLGDATLKARAGETPDPLNGSVSYEVAGISALYHLYNSQGTDGRLYRDGLDLFVKAGVGTLDTSSDDLAIEQIEDVQYMLGVGVEYAIGDHLALRGEVELFDEDAQLASLGLLWRFGGGERDASAAVPAVAATAAATTAETESAATPAAAPLDSDGDGVADVLDTCSGTKSGVSVNSSGCPRFDGPIAGVNFLSGSGELTEDAKAVLDQVAADLSRSPSIRVAVMAHTDNQGGAAGNLELSKRRAISVAKYLVSQGVSAGQLRPEAYGESRPLVSNATAEGRRQNRRIELRTVN